LQETTEVLTMKLRAKATDLPAQKDELVLLVKALRKTLKVRPHLRTPAAQQRAGGGRN